MLWRPLRLLLRSWGTATLLLPAMPVAAAPLAPTEAELAARTALSARLPSARLLWVRDKKIFHTRLERWQPEQVTEGGYEEDRPRWSPDGRRIIFERAGSGVHLMNEDFSGKVLVIPDAHTADWTADGKAITAIAKDGYRVLRYEFESARITVIYDARWPGFNGQQISQAAQLHPEGRYLLVFREKPQHATEIVDLENRRYLANTQMLRGDCSPAWAPSGRWFITTARAADRPLLKTSFDSHSGTIGESQHLVGLKTLWRFYAYDAQVSGDEHWVTFAGKILLGSGMFGRGEIYLWQIGGFGSAPIRLTFDTAEDNQPSLFVPP